MSRSRDSGLAGQGRSLWEGSGQTPDWHQGHPEGPSEFDVVGTGDSGLEGSGDSGLRRSGDSGLGPETPV